MASVQHARSRGNLYKDFDKQLIAGKWRTGNGKGRLTDRNPYNGDLLVDIPNADEQDLDEAFKAAARAQKAWARRLPSERAAVMLRAAQAMDARHDEIVQMLIDEAGSTRIKAELEFAAVRAVMMEASFAYRMDGRRSSEAIVGCSGGKPWREARARLIGSSAPPRSRCCQRPVAMAKRDGEHTAEFA